MFFLYQIESTYSEFFIQAKSYEDAIEASQIVLNSIYKNKNSEQVKYCFKLNSFNTTFQKYINAGIHLYNANDVLKYYEKDI